MTGAAGGTSGNDHHNEKWSNAAHHDLAIRHKVNEKGGVCCVCVYVVCCGVLWFVMWFVVWRVMCS